MIDKKQIKILVVGCGNMGASHAKSYEAHTHFEICGLVARGPSKSRLNAELRGDYPIFDDYATALKQTTPDAVCISTYPETHEPYTLMALEQDCHVFLEKPIATTVIGGLRISEKAKALNKKVVVGYILRHHLVWKRFIEEAKKLGKPLVMRMNLNQQSQGYMWNVHKSLMQSLSPIVDCGVHYLDVMCQMTQARPVSVSAIGARLTDEIPSDNYNYGQLQIRFDDGSVGWYEAGWGPMVSETAFFVKDVFGPNGSVSLTQDEQRSDCVDGHSKADLMRIHHADLDEHNQFTKTDDLIRFEQSPDHQELCDNEQAYFFDAINNDLDLSSHLNDAVTSLQIALACDQSVKEQRTIIL
jgi:predicted dehydrogenase